MNNSNNPNRSAGVDKRVSKVTGDPKKAIRSLSVPIIMSLLLMMSYNLANSVWVSGLGANALAAVGFVTPIFMMVIGLGNGLGAGANSLISRCIGAKNKKGSDNAAIHSIILSLIISVILTIFLLIFLEKILLAMQVGESLSLAMEYGQIVFGGLIFIIFTSVASGILRAEGDFKRPMYAMAATAVLNIILDPIFIYYFGWGVSGAAIGTVISSMISSALIFYWLLIKRDTYVSLSRKDFHASWNVTKDILNVGLPASAEFFVMSILGIILNLMLVIVGGTEAVAVYTAGWRVVMIGMVPAIGIGMAAITVAGSSYGSKKYDNVSTVLNYSAKLAVGVALITGLIIYVFASNIAFIFAYSSESAFMAPSIAAFLQVMCIFLIVVALGIIASSIFQGMGKGLTSLILTLIREVLFISVFAYVFSLILGLGENGVWWGIVIGSVFGNSIAFIWAWKYIDRLKKNYKTDNIGNI